MTGLCLYVFLVMFSAMPAAQIEIAIVSICIV